MTRQKQDDPPESAAEATCFGCGKTVGGLLSKWQPGVGMRRFCPECLEKVSQSRALQKQAAAKRKQFGRVMGAVGELAGEDPGKLTDLWRELTTEFGGIRGVADFIYHQVMFAAEENPGGRSVLDACKMLVGLCRDATAVSAPLDLPAMDDNQLQAEIVRRERVVVIRDIIEREPALRPVLLKQYPEALGEPVPVGQ